MIKMNQELIQTLEDLVEKACRKDTNIFGYQVWTNHIKVVIQLAEQLSSELECCFRVKSRGRMCR